MQVRWDKASLKDMCAVLGRACCLDRNAAPIDQRSRIDLADTTGQDKAAKLGTHGLTDIPENQDSRAAEGVLWRPGDAPAHPNRCRSRLRCRPALLTWPAV